MKLRTEKTALEKLLAVRLKGRDAQRLESLQIRGLAHRAPLYTEPRCTPIPHLCGQANTPARNSAELTSMTQRGVKS